MLVYYDFYYNENGFSEIIFSIAKSFEKLTVYIVKSIMCDSFKTL